MFERLPRSKGNVVGVRATGKLTDADYKEFIPQLEEKISEYGQVRVLVDMEGFEGWDLLAAWDDFAFGMTHWHHFEKMALVGDNTWEKAAARVTDLLMRGEVRFFELDQATDAWEWIES